MAQTTKKRWVDVKGGSQFEQYDCDEAVTLGTCYAIVLTVDGRQINESTIVFNNSTCIGMDYKIFGSAKDLACAASICSDEWVNLISGASECDSSTYDHTSSKPLDANKVFYESFSNPWRWVIVQAKADSGTPTLKIWHRGER